MVHDHLEIFIEFRWLKRVSLSPRMLQHFIRETRRREGSTSPSRGKHGWRFTARMQVWFFRRTDYVGERDPSNWKISRLTLQNLIRIGLNLTEVYSFSLVFAIIFGYSSGPSIWQGMLGRMTQKSEIFMNMRYFHEMWNWAKFWIRQQQIDSILNFGGPAGGSRAWKGASPPTRYSTWLGKPFLLEE